MPNEKVTFWNSIVIKSALILTTIVVLVLFLQGYFINQKASKVIYNYSENQIVHASNLVKKSFYSMLSEVSNDIALITKNPAINEYVNDPNPDNYGILEKSFPIVLSEKPNYFQIRLLDAENNGKEIIKYEKINGRIKQVTSDNLQFKGDKKYYGEAMAIAEEGFYFSEINLNEEFGKISEPHIPTLRAIGKVLNNKGLLKALLVINVDVSAFFEEVNQIGKQDIENLLVNQVGEYKYSKERYKSFGTQLGTNLTLDKDFDVIPSEFLNKTETKGIFHDNKNVPHLYYLDKLPYSDGIHNIYLITTASKEAILTDVAKVNRDSFLIVIIFCLFLLVLIYMYTNIISKRLTHITSAISDYERGKDSDSSLFSLKKRKDEIGILARSFSSMRKEIDSRVIELKESLKREKKAVAEKNEFLQNMSHELRTPLNAILGLTQLLIKNKPSSAQVPIINSLHRSTYNLNGLMHDILEQQKLMEGQITLNSTPTNIYEQLQATVLNYRYEAIQKGLKLNLNVSNELMERYYLIDPLRLNQVITNLLINAIKYTAKGQIDILANLLQEKGTHLTIEVQDTGQGIDPENLLRIKERFFRVANDNSLRIDGFGLGLSIVKKLSDLFGGNLSVISELEKGSIFKFTMPIKDAPSPSTPELDATASYPKFHQKYVVLHVEDDAPSQLMVRNVLESIGVSVVQTNSAKQALELLSNNRFDLLLTDLMLEAELITDYVKNEFSKYNIPIIITSAFDPSNYRDLKIDHLQKPINLDQLADKIISVIGTNEYDVPQLKNVYEQYDYNNQKIINYLEILLSEFDQYLLRFKAVSNSRNQKEWMAIKHKIATHINALELTQLKNELPELVDELDQNMLHFLLNQIKFMQCYFRNELLINSVD
ncbi:hybrid sensor histidine kinase/response regulator [Maribacter sp. HTCC2170]|uniref:ATP-binding response regulator n=1 Tax=Maribacter sp. (strain HTCC2170 / KCCM 42371) TaxID=313603 RepID=UPI0002D6BE1A|nr:ATP-binding protein [Maribacter sp. HTCC2170]